MDIFILNPRKKIEEEKKKRNWSVVSVAKARLKNHFGGNSCLKSQNQIQNLKKNHTIHFYIYQKFQYISKMP